jgi:hypothetical protein
MRKISVFLIFFLILTQILTVNAQTGSASNAGQNSPSLIGQFIVAAGIAAVFSIIAYAGYKIVKKWGYSQPD